MLACSRDLAVRISDEPPATFRLPVDAARRKARDAIDQMPQNGLRSIVENWRPLPDGQIEFVVRQVRATD
jgi:hypothetical protein